MAQWPRALAGGSMTVLARDSGNCEKNSKNWFLLNSENCEKSSKNWFILSLRRGSGGSWGRPWGGLGGGSVLS